MLKRSCRVRQSFVHPSLIGGSFIAPKCGAMSLIGEAHDRIPINCRGNCLAKLQIAKPSLLALDIGQLARWKII